MSRFLCWALLSRACPPFTELFLFFGFWSQTSPTPSPSVSAWSELAAFGQLSEESGTPSVSASDASEPMTVVVAVDVLFARLESIEGGSGGSFSALTVAVLVRVPATVGRTTIVIVAGYPLKIWDTVQMIVVAPLHLNGCATPCSP